jgi:hypothetical protein
MALITLSYTFSVGNTIIASQHNLNNTVIYNDYNGNVTDANIAAGAAIQYTKLALAGSVAYADLSTSCKSSILSYVVPSGVIWMWSGTIATRPSGWYLCDGSNGTPDLRNKFIIAADADDSGVAKTTYTGSATQSGGSLHHTHGAGSFYTPGTVHAAGGTNQGTLMSGDNPDVLGTSANESSVPVIYYALAYIMKS